MEVWKSVKGYEGYEVSNLSNVRGLDRFVIRGSKQIPVKGKMMNKRLTEQGYHKVDLSKVKDGRKSHKGFFTHRLSAIAFIPNPENKPCVNHIDGNPLNNDIKNLEWVTYSENTIHAYKTGLLVRPKGEKSPLAKLTNLQVREIRANFRHGIDVKNEFARRYRINRTSISRILENKIYKDV